MEGDSLSDKDDDFFDCKESLDALNIDDKNERTCQSKPKNHSDDNGKSKENLTIDDDQQASKHTSENETTQEDADSGKEEDAESAQEEDADSDKEDNEDTLLTEEEIQSRRKESVEIKNNGNTLYKDLKFEEAIQVYSEGVELCPKCCHKELSVLYSNRAACFIALDKKPEALEDCNKALENDPNYLRALQRRAKLHEQMDKLEEALTDYKRVLELDPSVKPARQACMELPGRITEKNEKLKEEMMGKLKDLGNMCLKPFGLSTNNFKMQQNEGGSYNIQFVQNPDQR